jgi:hypothetical protein
LGQQQCHVQQGQGRVRGEKCVTHMKRLIRMHLLLLMGIAIRGRHGGDLSRARSY